MGVKREGKWMYDTHRRGARGYGSLNLQLRERAQGDIELAQGGVFEGEVVGVGFEGFGAELAAVGGGDDVGGFVCACVVEDDGGQVFVEPDALEAEEDAADRDVAFLQGFELAFEEVAIGHE